MMQKHGVWRSVPWEGRGREMMMMINVDVLHRQGCFCV